MCLQYKKFIDKETFMGTWGENIFENDITLDVKEDFLNHLKCGRSSFEATNIMIDKNKDIINDFEDAPLFWLSLADLQWDYGRLQPIVKEKALNHINQVLNLNCKIEQKQGYEIKKIELLKALEIKLQSPMPMKKKIRKYSYFHTLWMNGDVFLMQLTDQTTDYREFDGRYLVFITLHHSFEPKGDFGNYFPTGYLKISKTNVRPNSEIDIENCEFIKTLRYTKSNLSTYKTCIFTNSIKRISMFSYLGNYKVSFPFDEKLTKNRTKHDLEATYKDGYKGERYMPSSFIDLSKRSINRVIRNYLKYI